MLIEHPPKKEDQVKDKLLDIDQSIDQMSGDVFDSKDKLSDINKMLDDMDDMLDNISHNLDEMKQEVSTTKLVVQMLCYFVVGGIVLFMKS